MAAKPVPPPTAVQAPVAQTLVVRYAKRGRMRFASHRDVARAFERGVFRAGLPIAYSAGFSPHPKISYVGGAPTGVASEAEYLKLGLTSTDADVAAVRERLDAMLPDGIDVIDVTKAEAGFTEPEASLWQVTLQGVATEAAERAVAAFLALRQAPVERLTDKGVRKLDARGAVAALAVSRRGGVTDGDDCAILRMVVLHQSPAVRPADVLTALRPLTANAARTTRTTRLEQGSVAALTGKTIS
ncbi:MAG TPA: TIGR03936 family radical SAM-associated protein [Streptosporangiaceae bacterium]|nr:TIGR03936 family radical SAM-associated protein [Streptosporangiaceae bacterium]